jgi:hypothetical protein
VTGNLHTLAEERSIELHRPVGEIVSMPTDPGEHARARCLALPFAGFIDSATRLVAVVAALAVSSGCIANPWNECNDEERVAPGAKLNGVDPAASIEPLLGAHPATLTWIGTGRSTAFHLDVDRDRTAPVVAPIDCDNAVVGFDLDVSYRFSSDDGLLDGANAYAVELDPGGRQAHPMAFVYRLSSGSLTTEVATWPAGLVDHHFDVAIPIVNLAPGKSAVRLVWSDASRVTHWDSIGDIVFQ